MKFTIVLAVCVAITQAAPILSNSAGKDIPHEYIVVLKETANMASFTTNFNNMARRQNARGGVKTEILDEYQSFSGFHARLSPAAAKELSGSDDVDFIEKDSIMKISGQQASPPSWGLTRVSQKALNLKLPFLYNDAAGNGVTAYVIDTGINTAHTEFAGRATMGANFITGSPNTDENGHGTHVAGTIGGLKYGVAKKVKLVGIKVLGGDGSGSTSGVMKGMDWVASKAVPGKSVVNMSLGGGKSASIDAAAQRLFAKNIPLIVAAGNDAKVDACSGSPSGSQNAFTVGATDKFDNPAVFTSWGKCVEIMAPGVDITSAWIGSNTAKNTISGTSMATPHVVGVAALYLSSGTYATAQALFDKLSSTATPNVVKGNLKGSANKLVFNGGLLAGAIPK
ncbi:MAG: aqualysin 1 [Benniella sp.]|nr:MAG: aqualysin 1 [Benniella sp.]